MRFAAGAVRASQLFAAVISVFRRVDVFLKRRAESHRFARTYAIAQATPTTMTANDSLSATAAIASGQFTRVPTR
jgi:hypothetical protein